MSQYPSPQWFSGSEYTHRVAQCIAQYGPIARTTLAQLLGLSQGALSRITSDLIYAEVIEEDSDSDAHTKKLPKDFVPKDTSERRGRPQTALRIRADQRSFIGGNIHGKELSMVVTNALCEPLTSCVTVELDSTQPQDVAQQLSDVAVELSKDVDPQPVSMGLSVGGHATEDRFVTYAPFLHWDGHVDLGGMLYEKSGIPCAIFNDLDSLLFHESWFGSGVGLPRFAVLTIGSGVGYSLSENGLPVNYPAKSYGLAGHILVDPEGPRCFAGHIGCSQCLTNDSLAEEYSTMIGRQATFEEFAADARAGSSQAKQLVNRVCFRLGALIAATANFAMPEKVVVSGESSFLARMNTESIRNGISRYRPSQAAHVDFEILDFDWSDWAEAAAARAIARYIG
ncbi:ROK family protein [Alloscardovia criceti]|uniref:ROK family protein n=1 Tax=Alloscardovia criceti TaxID=356828 RepID=UPI000362E6EB|nr:ROK family protein [Alloscardovia criceti]